MLPRQTAKVSAGPNEERRTDLAPVRPVAVAMVGMSGAEAALLGAAIGATATVAVAIVGAVSRQRADAARRRESREAAAEHQREARAAAVEQQRATLVRRYLFQLQDAVESLDARLDNWAVGGGEEHSERVDPGYWKITMLYALARALGAERILAIEGVYPQLESVRPGLGQFLTKSGVDRAIAKCLGESLFRYHRLALADSAVNREPDGFRVVTYTEFRRRCEDVSWALGRLLETAYAALEPLKTDRKTMSSLRQSLTDIVDHLESVSRASSGELATLQAEGKTDAG
jgi:hypothetical protein